MTQTSGTPIQYRVTSPLIQLRTESPQAGDWPERTLRLGDVLPDWVGDDELQHLLEFQVIEAIR